MSTLNANVYNRHWTNVVIHYLPFKVLTGDVLFSVVIFMCLSVVKLYIDYSVWWRWLHCHQDRICRLDLLAGGKNTSGIVGSEIVCPNPKLIMNWYFPACHSTLSEVTLIFIHRSGLCVNFQVLFKSVLKGAQTPSAALAARMIARPVWRENYKSNTPGDLSSFCVMSMHKTSRSNFIQMKYFPLCFIVCAACIDWIDECSSTYVQARRCNILLWRSYYNIWPQRPQPSPSSLHLNLTFTPSWAHI